MEKQINELYEKINIASVLNSPFVIQSVMQHIGYRQRIAQEILSEQDEMKKDILIETFNYTNNQIKKLLAI